MKEMNARIMESYNLHTLFRKNDFYFKRKSEYLILQFRYS